MKFGGVTKRAQVTIFIIIAVFIVAVVAVYFILRSQQNVVNVPASIEPLYNTFLSCIQDYAYTGISVLESTGGYINIPQYDAGSIYNPFSSQLNFLGNNIPYWYYISANNIQKSQVPTRQEMQQQLGNFIDGKIRNCVLDTYYEQGFHVEMGVPKTQVSIGTNDVTINLNMNLNVDKENDKASVTNHKVTIGSNLGDLYNSALKIYDYEQKNLFLENYSIDALRSYAPVDGVEITCSPKIWSAEDIFSQLKQGIEANTLALRTNGKGKDYFNLKLPVSQSVRFLNSQNWTSTFEVNPSQGAVLVSNPVGNQAGLGILGFCYVPYHYVYNMKYPVLVQLSQGSEIFQFPMAVVVQGNEPRQAYDVSAVGTGEDTGVCTYANTPVEIRTFDNTANPVSADVSYQCVNQICNIGKTSNEGVLEGKFPQCVNGLITLKAEGYKESDFMYSTIQGGSADLILDKVYTVGVKLKVDGTAYSNKAIISFTATDNSSNTIIYPEQKSIQLSEGQYNIQVYIYGQSNLNLGQGTYRQCVDVLSGIQGVLGISQKKCFDVNVPSQIISSVLSGGGSTDYYISETNLKTGNIEISSQSLPTPSTLEQLQNNYLSFENKGLDISF